MTVYPHKVALITGGARRLGKDIAASVAEAGYHIVLNYNSSTPEILRNTIKELSVHKVEVIPYKADFSKPVEIIRIYNYIANRFKRLDLLINNAAIFRRVEFEDINAEILDEFFRINLRSVVLSSVEAVKIMKKNPLKPSVIINIASLGALENWTGFIPYSIAKAGVVKFTQLAAKKLSPDIIVNSISPGTILIDNDGNENVDFEDINKYPMKRFGNSKDIKSLINYLIQQNSFITGHNFILDGGKVL